MCARSNGVVPSWVAILGRDMWCTNRVNEQQMIEAVKPDPCGDHGDRAALQRGHAGGQQAKSYSTHPAEGVAGSQPSPTASSTKASTIPPPTTNTKAAAQASAKPVEQPRRRPCKTWQGPHVPTRRGRHGYSSLTGGEPSDTHRNQPARHPHGMKDAPPGALREVGRMSNELAADHRGCPGLPARSEIAPAWGGIR